MDSCTLLSSKEIQGVSSVPAPASDEQLIHPVTCWKVPLPGDSVASSKWG